MASSRLLRGRNPTNNPQQVPAGGLVPLRLWKGLRSTSPPAPEEVRDDRVKQPGLTNPYIVKTVADLKNFALYFSREPIPSRKKASDGEVTMYKQIAIIPFRRDMLIKFNKLEATPLETIESVDMLRLLEHGYRIKMVPTKHAICGVDTPEDLKKVDALMASDKLSALYIGGRPE